MQHQARRSLFPLLLMFFMVFGVEPKLATAQDTPPEKPASTQNNSQGKPNSGQSDRIVSLRKLPGNILQDQKTIFSFPKDLANGKHRWPTIGVVGVTTGLIASDPYTAPPFRTTTNFSGYNRLFSGANAGAFIAAVPVAMYAEGWLRKDSYSQNTALLAGEAVADGFILAVPFKAITGRKLPSDYTGNGPYSDSFFNGSHNPFSSGGFYSVHAMAATAVATVIARRYRKHRWVPYVAYGLAAAISFSRITRSDHFPADVFLGGAMGFAISRFAVLPAPN